MNDFKNRLNIERTELEGKLTKLNDFISSENFNNLVSIQKSLLTIQASAMNTYLDCLKERINNLVTY